MIRQYGVVAFRRDAVEGLRILLITSRETRRWVIPRGNPISGLGPGGSAEREAFEEAGVEGALGDTPLGVYRYRKRLRFGLSRLAEVTVFSLAVERLLDSWPEEKERTRAWFAPDEAADAVDEPGLKALLRSFSPHQAPAAER